jgi:dihydrodipicolinate synthase/N-acetylneuraminate lyase
MRRLGFFNKKSSALVPQKLSGLIAPLITPVNSDLSVDLFALKALTARLMNRGVRNFFVLSKFSDYNKLIHVDKQKILETVSEEVGGRGLILAGCFGPTAEDILSEIKEAEIYADFCVINLPERLIESELDFTDFFDSLMKETKTNILLYNSQGYGAQLIPEKIIDSLVNWERFIGIIDSSRDPSSLDYLAKYSQLIKIFEENEELVFDALRKGFSGVSCLSTLIFPSYYANLIENYDSIDYRTMARHEAKVSAISKMIPQNKRIASIKYVLSLQRLIQNFAFDSKDALTEKEMVFIEDAFRITRKDSTEENKLR